MKYKISIVVLLILLITTAAKSQQFGGGLKLGASFTQVDGDMYGGFNKVGVTGGAFVNYPIAERMLLQAEILFTQKGSNGGPTKDLPYRNTLNIYLNYFDIPVFASYNLVDKFWLQLGVMPSVLISGKQYINEIESINSPEFNSVDFSVVFGAAYKFAKHFSVNMNWTYSLFNIRNGLENGYSKSLFGYGQYNNVVSLNLLYHFK